MRKKVRNSSKIGRNLQTELNKYVLSSLIFLFQTKNPFFHRNMALNGGWNEKSTDDLVFTCENAKEG